MVINIFGAETSGFEASVSQRLSAWEHGWFPYPANRIVFEDSGGSGACLTLLVGKGFRFMMCCGLAEGFGVFLGGGGGY